jgi:hypothetical protein
MSNPYDVARRISALRVLAAFAVMGTSMEDVALAGNVSVEEAYEIIRADERRKAVEARGGCQF